MEGSYHSSLGNQEKSVLKDNNMISVWLGLLLSCTLQMEGLGWKILICGFIGFGENNCSSH